MDAVTRNDKEVIAELLREQNQLRLEGLEYTRKREERTLIKEQKQRHKDAERAKFYSFMRYAAVLLFLNSITWYFAVTSNSQLRSTNFKNNLALVGIGSISDISIPYPESIAGTPDPIFLGKARSRPRLNKWKVDPKLIQLLNIYEQRLGYKVNISWPKGAIGRHMGKHNKSRHNVDKWGRVMALDLVPVKKEPLKWAVVAAQTGFTGIGIYPDWPNGGIHVDVRNNKKGHISTWAGVSEGKNGKQVYKSLDYGLRKMGVKGAINLKADLPSHKVDDISDHLNKLLDSAKKVINDFVKEVTRPAPVVNGSIVLPEISQNASKGEIAKYVEKAGRQAGLPYGYMATLAYFEGAEFNRAAYNRGSKAKGLWQYLPSTAKGNGLIKNGKDYRSDIKISTEQAIKDQLNERRWLAGVGININNQNQEYLYFPHNLGRCGFLQTWRLKNGKPSTQCKGKNGAFTIHKATLYLNAKSNVHGKYKAMIKKRSRICVYKWKPTRCLTKAGADVYFKSMTELFHSKQRKAVKYL